VPWLVFSSQVRFLAKALNATQFVWAKRRRSSCQAKRQRFVRHYSPALSFAETVTNEAATWNFCSPQRFLLHGSPLAGRMDRVF
jgi:hypothetical protein